MISPRAFYFESNGAPLYAYLHPAKEKKRRHIGALFCYPLGHEYFRVHRLYKQLASRLAKQGIDCLRFDYFGTGDSAGASEEIRLPVCESNIRDALTQLAALTEARRYYCIGHWLGATLALAATEACATINGLILCDPVLDGNAHLQGWRESHRQAVAAYYEAPPADCGDKPAAGEHEELFGFRYRQELLEQVGQIDYRNLNKNPRARATLISSNAPSFGASSPLVDDFVSRIRDRGELCQQESHYVDISHQDREYDLLLSLPTGELFEKLIRYLV